jgi:electron transfer flavoprotein beta subunit
MLKIVVMIKQVPETKSVKMDEKTGTLIREGIESIVNPIDLYAIELSIRLKEIYGASVLGISMGPPKAAEALKEAISMGIDEAVLLSDKFLAGSDTWATAYALAECVKKQGEYHLIICGEKATDGDTGQVGPGIAAHLGIPVISYANKFIEINENGIRVHRQVEDGEEIISSSLPSLITVVKEISNPRLPTFRGKIRAKKTQIPVLKASDLGLDLSKIGLKGSPTRVEKIFQPKVARECEKHIAKDSMQTESAADAFISLLKQKNML